jgi:hypothetical protein
MTTKIPRSIIAAGIVAGLALIGCASGGPADPPGTPPPPPTSTAAGDMTLGEFNQIHQGMTYDQVTELVGSQGVRISEAGNVAIYNYRGTTPMGNATVTFTDGKVTGLGQFGLQ